MSFQSPRFPTEIFDCFIDFFGRRYPENDFDLESLASCALVSRSFAHRARRHIFRQVSVTDEKCKGSLSPAANYLKTLHEIITWKPYHTHRDGLGNVTPYIKTLSCYYTVNEGVELWECMLSAILQAVHGPEHGITKFALICNSSWSGIGMGLQHAIRDLLLSTRLESLYVARITHLPKTLLVGSNIKHLLIRSCSMEIHRHNFYYSARYPLATKSYPVLESVDLDWFYTTLLETENFSGSGSDRSSVSSLQRLRCLLHSDFGMENFFFSLRNTLQDLTVSIERLTSSMTPSSFNLAHLEKLKRLRIYDDRPLCPVLPLSFTVPLKESGFHILEVLELPKCLQTFELKFMMDRDEDLSEHLQLCLDSFSAPPNHNPWSPLNVFFSSPHFANVAEVVITLAFPTPLENEARPDEEIFHCIKSLVRASLPHFTNPNTSSVLSVVVTDDLDIYYNTADIYDAIIR